MIVRRTFVASFLLCAGASCAAPAGSADLGTWLPSGAPAVDAASSSPGAGAPDASAAGPVTGGTSSGGSAGGSGLEAGTGVLPPPAVVVTASGLPCDVAGVLASKCTGCHSDPPITGSLSGLVTHADLIAVAKEDPTKNEAQLSLSRMQNAASPMPPAALATPATAADIATMQAWISGGYAVGDCGGDGGASIDAGPSVAVVNVFSGQTAFRGMTGPSSHNAGQDCMGCHTTGGGEAPRFLFGGTLYDGSGNPVVGAEVRVVDKNGVGYSVFTASNGNFYQNGSGLAVVANAGARNASSVALMVSGVTKPGCSSCHCTGASCVAPKIHLP